VPESVGTRSPSILLAESDPSLVRSLTALFEAHMPNIALDVCRTPDVTMRKLSSSPYQLLISSLPSLRLFEYFLKRPEQLLQPHAPILVTVGRDTIETATTALDKGIFDIICTPLNKVEALGTIRIALWQYRLKELTATKERALERWRSHLSSFPEQKQTEEVFRKTFACIDKTIATLARNVLTVEKSIALSRDVAVLLQREVKQRALARLEHFCSRMNQSTRPS
jgi:DNA-binding NtrC family response regulator